MTGKLQSLTLSITVDYCCIDVDFRLFFLCTGEMWQSVFFQQNGHNLLSRYGEQFRTLACSKV